MANVLVIGAGICGLGTALLLARDGHRVTVLERDDNPIPDSGRQAWDSWQRRGVAQFRQPHNFMPGLRRILNADLPDVQQALSTSGAARFDLMEPNPFADRARESIDDELWTYSARRPLGEWIFARAAEQEAGLEMRRGVRVVKLVTGTEVTAGIPHVTGVRTVDGEVIEADLVVDASGRGSRAPQWLEAVGARPVHEEAADCGFTYLTRYFEGDDPKRLGPVILNYGTISVLTLPGDHHTWSVTVFTSSEDKALRGLRDAERWGRVVEACPMQAHWLAGKPITDVMPMSGVVDRYRQFVVDGAPLATGFVAVADAWACTNPSAGRGLTVGFIHAQQLRDTLRRGLDDHVQFALQFDAVSQSAVKPWFDAQMAADRYRFAEIEALRRGEPRPRTDDPLLRGIGTLFLTMTADPMLYRAAMEYVATLTPVQQVLARPEVTERMTEVASEMRGSPPAAPPGPDRETLLELVA